MTLTKSDLARISRVLQKEECVQPIAGSVRLSGNGLRMSFDSPVNDAQDALRALMAHHLNTDIDADSSEARSKMIDGYAFLEIDIKAFLYHFVRSL